MGSCDLLSGGGTRCPKRDGWRERKDVGERSQWREERRESGREGGEDVDDWEGYT